jgi:hypothetical protein
MHCRSRFIGSNSACDVPKRVGGATKGTYINPEGTLLDRDRVPDRS